MLLLLLMSVLFSIIVEKRSSCFCLWRLETLGYKIGDIVENVYMDLHKVFKNLIPINKMKTCSQGGGKQTQ